MLNSSFKFPVNYRAVSGRARRPISRPVHLMASRFWLGHAQMQTTEVYMRADPLEKIETIEGVTPLNLKRGRFTAPDKLIASLKVK